MDLQKTDKKAVGFLTAGHLTADMYGGFIHPVMPFIAANIGMSMASAAILISLSSLTSSLLQPIFGHISDTLKRRFFLFVGIIFAAVFISLTGMASNIWILGLLLLLGNLGVGFFHPQATGLVAVFSGKEINKLMGIFTAFGTLGYALGPTVSSMLVGNFGVKSTIWAVIPGLLFVLLMYKFLPKIPEKTVRKEKTAILDAIKIVIKNSTLLLLTGVSIIKAIVIISFCVLMPFVWKTSGLALNGLSTVFVIGASLSMFSILGGFGSFSGGFITDRIGQKPVFLLSLIPVTPCLLGSLYLLDKMPILSLVLFITGGYFINLSVSVNMIMAQLVTPENKGFVSGIIGGFSWGIGSIALSIIGFLSSKFGTASILSVVAVTPLVGSLFVSYLPDSIENKSV